MGLTGLMLVWVSAIPGELSEEYRLDFRSVQRLPPAWELTMPVAEKWIHPGPEGLRVSLPADRPNLAPVGLATGFAVHGDFEITAAYQVLKAEAPESGFGVGVILTVEKVKPSSEWAEVAWVVCAKGREVAAWDRNLPGPEGKARFMRGEKPSSARVGRLRFRRSGSKLSYLLAEGLAGEEYREIHQCDFGAEDLQRVVLKVVTSRQRRAIDARWIDFQIRSEGLPSVAQPPGSGNAFWLAIAVTGAVILGGGIEGWRRWRRRQHSLNEKQMSSARQVGKGRS